VCGGRSDSDSESIRRDRLRGSHSGTIGGGNDAVAVIFGSGGAAGGADVSACRVSLEDKVLDGNIVGGRHIGGIERDPNNRLKGGVVRRRIANNQVSINAGGVRIVTVDGNVVCAIQLDDAKSTGGG